MSAVQMPIDKTRRKRLKVISACSECRRKKTKCNGENPCSGCIKANVDCKYSTSPKSRPSNATSTSTIQQQQQQQQQQQRLNESNNKSTDMISSIENRLSVIEDILHVLLLNSSPGREHTHRNSAILLERKPGPYYGYHRFGEKRRYEEIDNNYNNNWVVPRAPRNEIRLPPIQPPLSESSSTSTTSSTCSAYSPKINTIHTLLNEEEKEHRPSAFFKPTAAGTGRF